MKQICQRFEDTITCSLKDPLQWMDAARIQPADKNISNPHHSSQKT